MKYIVGAIRQRRKKGGDTKSLTCPHLEPNQSKKSIKGKGPTSMYNFVQERQHLSWNVRGINGGGGESEKLLNP